MAYQSKFFNRRQTNTGSPLHQPSILSTGFNSTTAATPGDGGAMVNGIGLQRKSSRNYEREREREAEERASLPSSRKYSLTQAIANGSVGPTTAFPYADGEDGLPPSAAFHQREALSHLLRRTQSTRGIERSPAALQRAGTLSNRQDTQQQLTPSALSFDKQFLLQTFPQIDDRYLQLDFANQEILSKCTAGDLLPKGSAEITREFMGTLVTMLLNYVEMENDRTTRVLEFRHPKQLEQIIDIDIPDEEAPSNLYQLLLDCQQALQYQVRSGHPRFFNQISTGLDLVSLAGEWLTSTANSNMFTYEVSPVFVLIEKIVLQKMRELIGWSSGDGIFAPGGSISNLYAVHLARHRKFPQCKSKGVACLNKKLVIFTSAHCHYSIPSAASVLGLGSDNVVEIPVDDRGKMDLKELERQIITCLDHGDEPLLVNATAGTTVLGAFDPINGIADLCEKYDIWLHIDAAWGGGVLLSRQHRHLVHGIERAQSVTWNPHKMMGAHLQCSAIITREPNLLFSCNNMSADYLFQQDKHYNVEYDTGDKAIQCGRRNDVFKLWLMWRAKGTLGFEKQINGLFELRDYLVGRLRELQDFELLLTEPECTNVCFWYVSPSCASFVGNRRYERLGRITAIIKARMMDRGSLMVGYQPLDDKPNFFRPIISNAGSTKEDIDFMLEEIVRIGREL
ncbi:LOW QUALITY PROTEIN: glutamate decarboxylase-like [Paramacrobiotus metropolitanus]|uniref:LOW QUALITY PROTEIN: glutamate decarboxylase-like n=1 Tax=Paramacrobiotus metropolitanus TaxID=2943436 RepID=UPI00244652DB|nr:LOW QUALITY PROTEIN: glutamate decarboxylase-like [Paramacrobiotus metropolitanus]